MSYSYNFSFSYDNQMIEGDCMNLLKELGSKELARITYNELRTRRYKRKMDLNSYEFERSDQIRKRCGLRRTGRF